MGICNTLTNHLNECKFTDSSEDWALGPSIVQLTSELLIKLSYRILPIAEIQPWLETGNLLTRAAHNVKFLKKIDFTSAAYNPPLIHKRVLDGLR